MIMGAKLAHPDAVCVNVMGDASIGMVGMDIETAVRNRIGIITIVFNNGIMAGERLGMEHAIEQYNAIDLGGDYRAVAAGLGAWSKRIEDVEEFLPPRARRSTSAPAGRPALIESDGQRVHALLALLNRDESPPRALPMLRAPPDAPRARARAAEPIQVIGTPR